MCLGTFPFCIILVSVVSIYGFADGRQHQRHGLAGVEQHHGLGGGKQHHSFVEGKQSPQRGKPFEVEGVDRVTKFVKKHLVDQNAVKPKISEHKNHEQANDPDHKAYPPKRFLPPPTLEQALSTWTNPLDGEDGKHPKTTCPRDALSIRLVRMGDLLRLECVTLVLKLRKLAREQRCAILEDADHDLKRHGKACVMIFEKIVDEVATGNVEQNLLRAIVTVQAENEAIEKDALQRFMATNGDSYKSPNDETKNEVDKILAAALLWRGDNNKATSLVVNSTAKIVNKGVKRIMASASKNLTNSTWKENTTKYEKWGIDHTTESNSTGISPSPWPSRWINVYNNAFSNPSRNEGKSTTTPSPSDGNNSTTTPAGPDNKAISKTNAESDDTNVSSIPGNDTKASSTQSPGNDTNAVPTPSPSHDKSTLSPLPTRTPKETLDSELSMPTPSNYTDLLQRTQNAVLSFIENERQANRYEDSLKEDGVRTSTKSDKRTPHHRVVAFIENHERKTHSLENDWPDKDELDKDWGKSPDASAKDGSTVENRNSEEVGEISSIVERMDFSTDRIFGLLHDLQNRVDEHADVVDWCLTNEILPPDHEVSKLESPLIVQRPLSARRARMLENFEHPTQTPFAKSLLRSANEYAYLEDETPSIIHDQVDEARAVLRHARMQERQESDREMLGTEIFILGLLLGVFFILLIYVVKKKAVL